MGNSRFDGKITGKPNARKPVEKIRCGKLYKIILYHVDFGTGFRDFLPSKFDTCNVSLYDLRLFVVAGRRIRRITCTQISPQMPD